MPLISIITPVFNRQHLIGKTITSVIKQTFQDWEMLVVDDGSEDGTQEIIRMYQQQDERIKLLKRKRQPKGAATCRNIGIDIASGDYVIFLDSDDRLQPFALEQRVRALEQYNGYDFLVFQTVKIDYSSNKELGMWYNLDNSENFLLELLKLKAPWQTAGPIWKLASLLKYSIKFDEKLLIWQDVDFHLQALYKGLKYRIMNDFPADVLYLVHSDALSQRGYTYNQRRSQIYFLQKHYALCRDNPQALSILRDLINKLIIKNLRAKYFDNVLRLLCLKITKR